MPHFEVFIPAKDADSFNIQLTVQAANWLGALRTGLANIGEGPNTISNIMCDIKEDSSIHVTDPATGRVFRLKEVPAPGTAASAAAPPPPAPPAPAPVPPPPPRAPVATQLFNPGTQAPPPVPAAAPPPPPRPAPPPPPAPVVAAPVPPPPPAPVAAKAPPPPPPAPAAAKVPPPPPPAPAKPAKTASKTDATPSKPSKTVSEMAAVRKVENQFQSAPQPVQRAETKERPPAPIGRVPQALPAPFNVEEVLAELFEKMQDVYGGPLDAEHVSNALLDMAMSYIKCDAGTFYTSDLSGGDLQFTAVRGPAAKEILKQKLTVAVGQGIVGFSAQEGVSLAISDVLKDARFAATISERIGYSCRNMICAPLYKDGRLWGAIQLINRLGANAFHPHEVDVLNYIAHEGAILLAAAEG